MQGTKIQKISIENMEFLNFTKSTNFETHHVSKVYYCKYGMPLAHDIIDALSTNQFLLLLIPIWLTLSSYYFCILNVKNIFATQPKIYFTNTLTLVGVYPVIKMLITNN